MAHPGENVAQPPIAPFGVALVVHHHLAAAVALDAQDGKAAKGCVMASVGEGRGSVP